MMSLTMSRIDSSRPPGVSRRKMTRSALSLFASSSASLTQAAEPGLIVTSSAKDSTRGRSADPCPVAAAPVSSANMTAAAAIAPMRMVVELLLGAGTCRGDCVLAHVVGQRGLGGVAAGLGVDALPAAVVEGRGGEALRDAEQLRDVAVGIDEAWVRNRDLAEELLRRAVRVLRVHGEEGDPLSAPHRLLLEERELVAAGPAPGRPLVDHDGVSAQGGKLAAKRVGSALDQLTGLPVESRQRGGSTLEGAPEVRLGRGAVRRLRSAACEGDREGHGERHESAR